VAQLKINPPHVRVLDPEHPQHSGIDAFAEVDADAAKPRIGTIAFIRRNHQPRLAPVDKIRRFCPGGLASDPAEPAVGGVFLKLRVVLDRLP